LSVQAACGAIGAGYLSLCGENSLVGRGLRSLQVLPRYPFAGNLATSLGPLALRQNSEVVHGLDKLTHRSPHIQLAKTCGEASKRRKEFSNSPAHSCQCFCVMDAPEIYQSPGLVVVSELLTAIEANQVGFSAKYKSGPRYLGWHGLAQRYRRTPMPMGTYKDKTQQCPYKERYPQDHIPPRFRSGKRSFRSELAFRCRTIQNYRPVDSVRAGHFFLLLRLHGSTTSGC